jgi:hypothetical protein
MQFLQLDKDAVCIIRFTTIAWSMLNSMWCSPWDLNRPASPLDRSAFIDILHFADFALIKPAMTYALEKLASPTMGLHPMEKLDIACRFKIRLEAWVDEPLRALLFDDPSAPFQAITLDMISEASLPVYHELVKSKLALERERRILAYHIPTLTEADDGWPWCPNHDRCTKSFNSLWMSIVVPAIIKPSKPMNLRDGRACFGWFETLSFNGVAPQCKDALLAKLRRIPGEGAFGQGASHIFESLRILAYYHIPLHPLLASE